MPRTHAFPVIGIFTACLLAAAAASAAVDQAPATSTTIPVTDPNLRFSPWNWYSDGSGAPLTRTNVRSKSTRVQSNQPGAYGRIAVTGTTSLYLDVDLSSLVGKVNRGWYPVLSYSLNQADWVDAPLDVSEGTPIRITSLDPKATNQVWWVFRRVCTQVDRWKDLLSVVTVMDYRVDVGGRTTALTGYYADRAHQIRIVGDSITEGCFIHGTEIADHDALSAWWWPMIDALDAEVGVTAYGGWGYLHAGDGWVPRFYDPKDPANQSYADYFKGHSRLCDGKLVPLPTMSFLALGTNDMGAVGIQEAMQAYLPVERAICGDDCRLFQIIPPYGMLRQEINAAIAGYRGASKDARIQVIDGGPWMNAGFIPHSLVSTDGTHLNVRGNAKFGACILHAIGEAEPQQHREKLMP